MNEIFCWPCSTLTAFGKFSGNSNIVYPDWSFSGSWSDIATLVIPGTNTVSVADPGSGIRCLFDPWIRSWSDLFDVIMLYNFCKFIFIRGPIRRWFSYLRKDWKALKKVILQSYDLNLYIWPSVRVENLCIMNHSGSTTQAVNEAKNLTKQVLGNWIISHNKLWGAVEFRHFLQKITDIPSPVSVQIYHCTGTVLCIRFGIPSLDKLKK
jgi:hypothetical protein